jgi:hypothetical protein
MLSDMPLRGAGVQPPVQVRRQVAVIPGRDFSEVITQRIDKFALFMAPAR